MLNKEICIKLYMWDNERKVEKELQRRLDTIQRTTKLRAVTVLSETRKVSRELSVDSVIDYLENYLKKHVVSVDNDMLNDLIRETIIYILKNI